MKLKAYAGAVRRLWTDFPKRRRSGSLALCTGIPGIRSRWFEANFEAMLEEVYAVKAECESPETLLDLYSRKCPRSEGPSIMLVLEHLPVGC